MKKNTSADNRGFSLIEVIAVVLIIGVLATGAVIAFSSIYNADAERAAKNLYEVFAKGRTNAITYNDETTAKKVDIIVYIEQRDNGDYYAGIDKKTTFKSSDPLVTPPTPTVEHIEEVKISDYHLKLLFGTKGSTLGSATELKHDESLYSGADSGRIEYSFKRGTGRLTPSPVTTPATITSSDYCDIYVEGSSSFKLILSTASGKCFIYNE